MSELLTHGGDWAGFLSERGKLPLDFSASISPLGVPGGVRAAVRQAAGQMDRYPDPLCRALRESISEYELVPPQQILCGNGAAELIFRVVWALRPRQALVTAPTFSEYGAALQSVGCCGATSFLRNSDKIYEKKRNASQAPGRRFWPSAAARGPRTRTRSWRPLWTRWRPPGSLIVRSVGWRWTTRPTPCDCYCSRWGGM